MSKTIWTIGHSTRNLADFINNLTEYNIEILVDIRSLPGSSKYPAYNQENLSMSLADFGIEYFHNTLLGGLRPTSKNSKNNVWKNKSFRGYADYMSTPEFAEGIKMLELTALKKRTAIMCAEILWWRCHRSMVADFMKSIGWKVIHIQDNNTNQEHPYTSPAKIIDGNLRYCE